MTYDTIDVQEKFDGRVTEITLAMPPANVLTAQMMTEISVQLDQDMSDPHKKLILFRGEGKHFSFGASVDEHTPDQVDAMLPAFHRLIGKILDCDIPTMAQISGMCLGGSFELAMACTFIWADETAKLGVPEIQLGVFPPVASVLLPSRCNPGLTSEIILTGNTWKAIDLAESGLVQKIVPPGQLESAGDTFFEKELQPKSACSLRLAHRANRMGIAKTYHEFIPHLEELYLKDLMTTHDAVEGITSFLEKRKPVWRDS